ncbi:MAG: response regulator [Parvularculaceae bacterium]
MSNAQQDTSAKLEKLRRDYAVWLSTTAEELKAAHEELRSGAIAGERLDAIRRTAHRLAGSAGTFGHHTLGRFARKLEQAAKASAENLDPTSLASCLAMTIDLIGDAGEPQDARVEAINIPEKPPAGAARKRARVLIAEDNSVTQEILKLVLTQRGHSVDIASDGAEALKALRGAAYDVALLDFHLPAMDGVQIVSTYLAEKESHPRPLFVAITADVEGLLAHKENCETFDKVVHKPVNIADICSIVDAFDKKPETRPATTSVSAVPIAAFEESPKSAAKDDISELLALGCNFLRWPHDLNPHRLSARALQATIRKENFDAVLIDELRGAADISSIWNVRFLHLLPIIDCTGRLGPRADFDFSNPTRKDVEKVDELIRLFNLRAAQLHRDILYSDDLGEKLLARIYVSNAALSPIYDARSRSLVQYNTVLDFDVIAKQVAPLIEKQLLKPNFFDRVHCCGNCGSSLFNTREECPYCRSSNINEESYLHHFKCAYQGPESDFRRGDDLVCPKCKSDLRHFGHDYDRPGAMLRCNACGHATSEPMVGFVCVRCGTHTDGDAIETRDIHSYELTDQAIAYLEGGSAVHGFSQEKLRFSELPLDLIIALNEEAQKYNENKTPFALLEVAYHNEREIHDEGGSRQFNNIRKQFLENLRVILGADAKIVQGRAFDFALIRGESPNDARRRADFACEQATKNLKLDPGAAVTVFGPEDLR